MGAADQLGRPQHIGQLATERRQADQRIVEPILPPQARRKVVGTGETDHQIQFPLLQLPLVVAVSQVAHLQPTVGRESMEPIHQHWHHPMLHRARGGDAKNPPRGGGIKPLGLSQPLLQHRQCLPYRPGQRLGPLGRHHLAPAHHKQRIIQRYSQPPQRVADGGLGQM